MGIQGLLQGLKFATTAGNITDYKGQAVCVDGSSWLHKSVYSISEHYVECLERGGSLDKKSINVASAYIKSRCDELLKYAGIRQIYFVMDGKRCPLKAGTNADRDSRREENLKEARRLKQGGDNHGAFEKYKACIKITERLTKEVAANLARAFPDGRVELVQAPYEADPQLVKLCVDGYCSAIVTEDSDVLVYSAAARQIVPILFKLDRKNGQCQVASMAWLLCPNNNLSLRAQPVDDKKNKKSNGIESSLEAFAAREARDPGLGVRLFIQSCILAGCDYAINELDGVGLVNAFKAIKGAIHREDQDRFRHAMTLLPSKACKGIDKIQYEELLAKSEAVFYHHPVMENSGRVVYLVNPERSDPHIPSMERFGGDTSFVGNVSASSRPFELLHDCTNLADKPPVAEIAVKHKASRDKRRKSTSSYEEGLEKAREVAPMLNPYMNSKKRSHEAIQRQVDAAAQLATKPHPFAAFMAKSKENKKQRQAVSKKNDRQPRREYKSIQSAEHGIGVEAFLASLPQPKSGPQRQYGAAAPPGQPWNMSHERSTHRRVEECQDSRNSYIGRGSKRIRPSESERQHWQHQELTANAPSFPGAVHDESHSAVAMDLTGEPTIPMNVNGVYATSYNPRNFACRAQTSASHRSAAKPSPSDVHRHLRHHTALPYDGVPEDRAEVHEAICEPSVRDSSGAAFAFYDLCGSDAYTEQSSSWRACSRSTSHTSVDPFVCRGDFDELSDAPSPGIFSQQSQRHQPAEQFTRQSSHGREYCGAQVYNEERDAFTAKDHFHDTKGISLFQPKVEQSQTSSSMAAKANDFPRRVTNDLFPEIKKASTLNLASPQKQHLFEYDDWLASPQTKDHVMTAQELHADDIDSSPECFKPRPPPGLMHRNQGMPASTIGPAKIFRNRFHSNTMHIAKKGLFPSRGQKGPGLIQGSLSEFFGRRN